MAVASHPTLIETLLEFGVPEALFEHAPIAKAVPKGIVAGDQYVQDSKEAYLLRKRFREQMGLTVIGVAGYGRAGKDETGAYLARRYNLGYCGSLSRFFLPLWAASLDAPPTLVWRTRHRHRRYWFEWCNKLREFDPAVLCRTSAAWSDMAVGCRDKIELEAAKKEGIVQEWWWIDRTGNPVDPTVTYTADDCDVVLTNDGDLAKLYATIDERMAALGVRPVA